MMTLTTKFPRNYDQLHLNRSAHDDTLPETFQETTIDDTLTKSVKDDIYQSVCESRETGTRVPGVCGKYLKKKKLRILPRFAI